MCWNCSPMAHPKRVLYTTNGDMAGKTILFTLFAWRQPSGIRARWGLKLSSWKIKKWVRRLFSGAKYGSTCDARTSLMYRCLFIIIYFSFEEDYVSLCSRLIPDPWNNSATLKGYPWDLILRLEYVITCRISRLISCHPLCAEKNSGNIILLH